MSSAVTVSAIETEGASQLAVNMKAHKEDNVFFIVNPPLPFLPLLIRINL